MAALVYAVTHREGFTGLRSVTDHTLPLEARGLLRQVPLSEFAPLVHSPVGEGVFVDAGLKVPTHVYFGADDQLTLDSETVLDTRAHMLAELVVRHVRQVGAGVPLPVVRITGFASITSDSPEDSDAAESGGEGRAHLVRVSLMQKISDYLEALTVRGIRLVDMNKLVPAALVSGELEPTPPDPADGRRVVITIEFRPVGPYKLSAADAGLTAGSEASDSLAAEESLSTLSTPRTRSAPGDTEFAEGSELVGGGHRLDGGSHLDSPLGPGRGSVSAMSGQSSSPVPGEVKTESNGKPSTRSAQPQEVTGSVPPDTAGVKPQDKVTAAGAAEDSDTADAVQELTDARRVRDEAAQVFIEADGAFNRGEGSSVSADGSYVVAAWGRYREADRSVASAEQQWRLATGGEALPYVAEVMESRGTGLPGGAPPSFPGRRGKGKTLKSEEMIIQAERTPLTHKLVSGAKVVGEARIPSGPDLVIAQRLLGNQAAPFLSEWQGVGGAASSSTGKRGHAPELYTQWAESRSEDLEIYRALRGRIEWSQLRPPQVAALVLAERRGRQVEAETRAALVEKLTRGEWHWASDYPRERQRVEALIDKVHDFMQHGMDLTYNLTLEKKEDGWSSRSRTHIDRILNDPNAPLPNGWEMEQRPHTYFVKRGETEEVLGYPATVKRTKAAEPRGIYQSKQDGHPSRPDFTPLAQDMADLPKYAALISRLQPRGIPKYGSAVFHYKPEVRLRATFTPADSLQFYGSLSGAQGVTGSQHLLPLLLHGQERVVRLAFAEATEFRFDSEFRKLLDQGELEQELGKWHLSHGNWFPSYFEAQIHGDATWKDLKKVTLIQSDNPNDATDSHKRKLEQFAKEHNLSFVVEVRAAQSR
ncbi:hypothetical protein AB0L13_47670 [Saccharopolyspora shandongensis]|uniref:hypothetical protein n=1 Tax=Saccharopolyspora shandongensis TaxID=418495 RepID=UPI0034493A70